MDKATREFLFFFIKLLLIWLSWKLFIYVVGEESTKSYNTLWVQGSLAWKSFNAWYKLHLLTVCVWVLKAIGYPAELLRINSFGIGGLNPISVGDYCLGFQLMYYFTMLMAVTKMNWRRKLAGIAVGLLMANVLNVIRLCGLAIISAYYFQHSYFFHDYVFNIVVFGSLMVLYYWMVRKTE